MVSFNRFYEQQHEIAEITQVLAMLITERPLCDNSITGNLFEQYTRKVAEHLDLEGKLLYSKLLTSGDRSRQNTATSFLEGSREIKRIFQHFTHRWCRHGLRIDDHACFVAETTEMFELVRQRIEDATEKLYPAVREELAA